MKVVGIETSGFVGSVAVCDGDTVVGKRTFGKALSHGKEIVSSLKDIFDEIKWEPNIIDLIAVSIGVVVHSCCTQAGHGPGVTTLISSADGAVDPVMDPCANIANYLKIGTARPQP